MSVRLIHEWNLNQNQIKIKILKKLKYFYSSKIQHKNEILYNQKVKRRATHLTLIFIIIQVQLLPGSYFEYFLN